MRVVLVSSLLLLTTVLAGCGGSSTPDDDAGAQTSPVATSWLLADMPAGAVPVLQAKQTAREGDQVVVRGRIGGRPDPMSHDVAMFVMMDPALPSCRERGDGCRKPWDYCCETTETITAHSATVQLVDDAKSPMAIDLGGHGFEPLDEVVVVGTVGPRPNEAMLVINAEKIHRVSG
ncbi:MAG: hypothetical protein ACYS15_11595 [Planctomycetota bacterium]|jgi:hypothetical protein